MTRRLEQLQCVSSGTWDSLEAEGFSGSKGQNQLGLGAAAATPVRLPAHYRRLAVVAYEQGRISEGELARFLRCTRVEAREVVAELTSSSEVSEREGAVYELSLDLNSGLRLAAGEAVRK
jgi:hypothetical protein